MHDALLYNYKGLRASPPDICIYRNVPSVFITCITVYKYSYLFPVIITHDNIPELNQLMRNRGERERESNDSPNFESAIKAKVS